MNKTNYLAVYDAVTYKEKIYIKKTKLLTTAVLGESQNRTGHFANSQH